MSFELSQGEYVVYEARKSWFILFTETIGLVFSILLPIILVSFLSAFDDIFIAGDVGALFMIVLLSWVFVVWNVLLIIWTDYYLDVLVVTNKYLVDIDQKGLFNRDVSVIELDKIQDINTEVSGAIATVINYGDIAIQSAGTSKEFVIKGLDKPNFIRMKIKEAIHGTVSETVSQNKYKRSKY